jgi:hypothetical protein
MRKHHRRSVAAIDIMANSFLAMFTLFVLTLIAQSLSKEKKEEKKIETAGEFLIIASWHDKLDDDVDLYVLDPSGQTVYFRAREIGFIHLERDDLGRFNDRVGDKVVEKNEERVHIRGIVAGEYVVNVHMYAKRDPKPTKVKISLVQLKGEDKAVIEKEVVLSEQGDEKTAFRFTLKADGSVHNINYLPRKLAVKNYLLGRQSPQQNERGGYEPWRPNN